MADYAARRALDVWYDTITLDVQPMVVTPDAVLTDAIPPARDMMLVSLADACGLLGRVLTDIVDDLAGDGHPA